MRLKKYIILARTDLLNATAYLKPFLVTKLFLVMILFIMFNLYKMLYGGRPAVDGFTLPMLLYYLTVTETIEMSKVRVYATISEEIKDGSCAYTLLRPLSYLSYHYCSSLARLAINGALTLAVGIAVTGLLCGFDLSILRGVLLALPAIFLAVNLNFAIMFIIGLMAFAMEEVSPVYWIYQKLVFIVGGLLVPLEFFPQWLRAIVQYLPTTYIAYFPAKCAVQWDAMFFLKGIAIQLGWLAFFVLVAQVMFRRGMGRLQVNGG
jgi:ABC-2 type transport system permease protein